MLGDSKNRAMRSNGSTSIANDTCEIHLAGYERVKNVGQGSFGIAVLYRKISDKSLVVLKQINMTELTDAEKYQAMNEVKVFSNLHHPNIIAYIGSFVRNRVLHIEMEYADGGTLAQIIAKRNANRDWMSETIVVDCLEQIASAINYMHTEHILHRDLKTANVFISKRGIVKIGDFGISKILNTRINAQTVLGTPFYLSPEMCEGREYGTKSDIWALGCIFGEMCCLEKAFAATNLSELVAKIMTAQYNPIPDRYSDSVRTVMSMLMQVDPENRPTASEILQNWIPLLHESRNSDTELTEQKTHKDDLYAKLPTNTISIIERSVIYHISSYSSKNIEIRPWQFPKDLKITSISSSLSHFLAVSKSGNVFAWRDYVYNSMEFNYIGDWNHIPSCVESLKTQQIVNAYAGESFSIFLTSNGSLLSCGDNRNGCLGIQSLNATSEPQIIDQLKGTIITKLSVGYQHVVACSSDNRLFAWGKCETGSLGLGPEQQFSSVPTRVEISDIGHRNVARIVCSFRCTFVLLDDGSVYACGNNTYNRLTFGSNVAYSTYLVKLKLDHTIIDVSSSEYVTAFLIKGGYVLTAGRNAEGQRGVGHLNPIAMPTLVKSLANRYVKSVKCSNNYCVAFTDDNVILLWGTRSGISSEDSKLDKQLIKSILSNSRTGHSTKPTQLYSSMLALEPVELLALYSSPEQLAKGHHLRVCDIRPLKLGIMLHVITTTPSEGI